VFCEFIHKPAIPQTHATSAGGWRGVSCTPRAATLTCTGIIGYVPCMSNRSIRHHHVHHHGLTGWGDTHVHG
jgi:hypothetical protein